MFEPIGRLALGLLTGIVFGVLLQKGRVAKYRVILGQFLLKDWTVLKIMGTAVVVGALGIYALLPTGAVALHVKPLEWGGILIGGLCFGAGMATLGYCPGTGVAACGEGRQDAYVGVLGMLVGAGLYVAVYPSLTAFLQRFGGEGKITLPEITGTSPWIWIAGLIVIATAVMLLLRRRHESPFSDSLSEGKPSL